MNYKSYMFRIRGENGKEIPANKHCPDDDAAIHLAKEQYSVNGLLAFYKEEEIKGKFID